MIPDFHEPLVTNELFQKVQRLLQENRTRTTPSPNRGDYLFLKLIVCGACGSPMSGHRNGTNQPTSYRCTSAAGTAQRTCDNNIVKEAEVLDYVLVALETQFLNPDFLRLCREQAERMDQECASASRVEALRKELATLDRDINRTRGRLARVDDQTFEYLNSEIAKWTERKRVVEAELAGSGQPSHGRRLEEFVDRLESLIRDLRSSVHGKDRNRIRVALREMLAWVKVKVEKRMVGTRPRYFLVGGEIMPRTAAGATRSRRQPSAEEAVCLSTDVQKCEQEEGAGTSASLSCSGPRASPR